MKELSIEEKAKRYDKAIEKATKWYDANTNEGYRGIFEDIFPELKESEDKRIRKALRERIINYDPNNEILIKEEGISQRQFLDWLEKQGDTKETLCDKCRKEQPSHSCQDITELGRCALEKQGEQKSLIIPKFRIGDIITPNGKKEYYTITDIVDGWYEFKEKHVNGGIPIHYQFGWELVEQHPDDIEPKFKQREWIVWQDKCYKINYNGCGYELVDQDGLSTSLEYGTIDENAHLWTIQDVRDGDVLVASDDSIFLFKGTIDCACKHYVALTTDGAVKFNEDLEHFWETSRAVHPATKEQRDQLEKAMADAGYTFDFNKKELKKIEQKSAWSEEDEEMYKKVETAIDSYYAPFSRDAEEMSEWFKNLKNRVLPKQEWGEEDKKMFVNIKACLRNANKDYSREVDWLKSLRPQSQWKPSDEQMVALKEACDEHWEPDGLDPLYTLYQNLKKLRGK